MLHQPAAVEAASHRCDEGQSDAGHGCEAGEIEGDGEAARNVSAGLGKERDQQERGEGEVPAQEAVGEILPVGGVGGRAILLLQRLEQNEEQSDERAFLQVGHDVVEFAVVGDVVGGAGDRRSSGKCEKLAAGQTSANQPGRDVRLGLIGARRTGNVGDGDHAYPEFSSRRWGGNAVPQPLSS